MNKDSIVEVQLRSAYGHDRVYPKNLTARLLLELTGRKTFSDADLKVIHQLGFVLEWVAEVPVGAE